MSPSADQVRAARALLGIGQDRLAHIADVGIATLRRFESGKLVGQLQRRALARALDGLGVMLVPGGIAFRE